ncbi:hypothetical protein N9L33_01920 [Nitrospinae bacterium]|nr:hypothetical protein [Nitrospinota bacterium]
MVNKGDVFAWIFFLAIWILPILARELRSGWRVMLTYWFVIFLHQAMALTNNFWFTIIGAEGDAKEFHLKGVELEQWENFTFGIDGYFYNNLLGIVYWLFGPSQLLGQELSILAFAVSCIILIKILHIMELSRYEVSVLLAYGALPSMVLLGSITLRESYQVLFFMLAIYWGIKMQMKGGVNSYLLFMVMSALVMGLFHNGLLIYSTFLIVLVMVWSLRPVTYFWNIKKLRLMAVFATLVLMVGVINLARVKLVGGLPGLVALANGDLLEAAATFRDFSRKSMTRATYGISLDLSSPFMTIYTSCKVYVHYLFAPFPWQVKNALDAYAAMESILRLTLIYFSVKHWRKAYGVQRRLLGLMLILFFSMTFMWAMGTTNYGTAIRHHMLSWWILIIAGTPLLMEVLSRVGFCLIVRKNSDSLEPNKKIL